MLQESFNRAVPHDSSDSVAGAHRVYTVGRLLAVLISAVFVFVLGRTAQLQWSPPTQIEELTNSQYSRIDIPSRRGPLYDRKGRPLAVTRATTRLFVDPQLIEDHNTFSERVGYTLNYDPAAIEQIISARIDKRFVVLDEQLSDERILRLRKLKLRGLGTQTGLLREYPQGTLAAPLIGFVGRDGEGLEGVERVFETQLNGDTGAMRYLRDAKRRPLFVEQDSYQPHKDGQAVRLTIDAVIQQIAEQELAATCDRFAAESGMIVIMDPHTGEILAMANHPGYDLRQFSKSPVGLRRNRCVTDVFEPGSTFKPFIWAFATQQEAAHPDEMFKAHQGLYVTRIGRRLHDSHPYGQLTWSQGLVKSSNIVMAQVGERMGNQRLYEAVRAFGFGQSTGSNLPGEVVGLVQQKKKWTAYSTTSIPMGQEVGVTALQMTRAFCAFANEGLLVTPTIQITPSDISTASVSIFERVISRQTAEKTRQTLRRVMTDGTGRKSDSAAYPIFGKTGTAQIARKNGGGYEEGAYLAAFVGAAPFDQPRLVIGCFIRKPNVNRGYYGGEVAGPAARNVLERSLIYLGEPLREVSAATLAVRE